MSNPVYFTRPAQALRRLAYAPKPILDSNAAALTTTAPSPSLSSSPFSSSSLSTPRTTRSSVLRPSAPTQIPPPPARPTTQRASLHSQPPSRRRRSQTAAPPEDADSKAPPATDFERMDVLGGAPVPATSIDACFPDGFKLSGGVSIFGGAGALLVNGEAFAWRPWLGGGNGSGESGVRGTKDPKLLNEKGQWEVPEEAFGLLGLVWPRPDLLIIGLGPEMRPLSPTTRRYISALGMRVDVLDTRNAASQFNLLATERGVSDVAAALIPLGWKEGVGAT